MEVDMKKVNGTWIAEEGKAPSKAMVYALILPSKGGCGWDFKAEGKQAYAVICERIEALGMDEVSVSEINEDIRESKAAKQAMRDRLNAMLAEAGFEKTEAKDKPKSKAKAKTKAKPKPKAKAKAEARDDLAARIAAAEAAIAAIKKAAGL